MNEQRRMQYLEAMGIDMFVPRFRLVQAKASVRASLPVAAQVPVAPKTISDVEQMLETEARDIATPSTSGARRFQSPEVAAVETPTSTSEARVAFNLSIWRVSATVLVIDAHQEGTGLPVERLLFNIFQACGLRISIPRADILRWPVVETPGKPMGWSAAREMVANYLEGKLLPQPVATMLLMGEAAVKAVAPGAGEYSECCFAGVSVDAFACEAVVLPSLAEILHRPLLKRQVWACLSQSPLISSFPDTAV